MAEQQPRKIELLAPAKNRICGIEAIRHGADAVYIGAPRFGARAAAGNGIDDIASLVEYAHLYNARVYVALNTLLTDDELLPVEAMIDELYQVGIDALIIQDMGITRMTLPPIPLHASTQMDNRTSERVAFLNDIGFRQIVLARELSLEEIRTIHRTVPTAALEVFVHGALCVSYSGQCYASQACFGRSANRGACAQFCRLPFSLQDADGREIAGRKHLLSLRDLNRIEHLEELLDAGVTSLKIEGRLKDVTYVKNVTAAYRQKLDALFERRKEYVRSSSGACRFHFEPQPGKSFNRGFTDYFLKGRSAKIDSFDTPKSRGEEMGVVKTVKENYFVLSGAGVFHNGDGACFMNKQGALQGFRINRVADNKVYPHEMPKLATHVTLYRNHDQEFEQRLSAANPTAERKIALSVELLETADGYMLSATDEDGNHLSLSFPLGKEEARNPQADYLKSQLGKLGTTPFVLKEFVSVLSGEWFIPASKLSEWRRTLVEQLLELRRANYPRLMAKWRDRRLTFPTSDGTSVLTYTGNVMNRSAAVFYREHGITSIEPAFEQQPVSGAVLMFCKHCLKYSLGLCPKYQRRTAYLVEPFYLASQDGRRFPLKFDCKKCTMQVLAPTVNGQLQ
ncbi:MAG: U32 family peptidase [Prevotellaceae bacterium]|jgi:putative protease|nr:U32 family peptidase [Prevotellaceae bacterium]